MNTLVALLVPFALAAPAPESVEPAARANVSITLIVGKAGGASGPEKTYRMLGQDGSTSRMLMGWRTPIPTRQGAETSYVYQNVGVSADLLPTVLADGRLLVEGGVEISGPRGGSRVEAVGDKAPLIGTFQQSLRVVLGLRKRLRVAEVPDPEGGTLFLDLEVDVLE